MANLHLYHVPEVVEITLDNGSALMNYPLNRTEIVLVRGVPNVVNVQIKDIDRQAVPLANANTNASATFTMTSVDGKVEALSRDLTITDAAKGYMRLSLDGEDTISLPTAFYVYTVTGTLADGTSFTAKMDRDRDIRGTVKLVEGPLATGVTFPSIFMNDMLLVNGNYRSSKFIGPANDRGVRRLVIMPRELTGRVAVQASGEKLPGQGDDGWVEIASQTFSDANSPVTIVLSDSRAQWIRLSVKIERGTLDEVQLF